MTPAAATSATALTVAQALGLANRAVLEVAPGELWVVGTVAGLVRSRPGHLYFQLADHEANGSTPSAVLPVVAFARDSVGINRTLAEAGVELANGLAVRLRGRLSIYPPKAAVQLVASAIDPAVTVGEGTLRKRRLLSALERERLLVRQRQLPAPAAPFHVGVVGPAGAGAADVLSVLRDSGLAFRAVRFLAASSGPGAPRAIAAALAEAARSRLDVIVLTRGGGPASDLAAFDSELVARAICECPVPIITALGHSTDRTVADTCAHLAAISPTDAAAAIVGRLADAGGQLTEEGRRIAQAARTLLGRAQAELEGHAGAISAARTQASETARARAGALRARRMALGVAAVAGVLIAALLVVVLVLVKGS